VPTNLLRPALLAAVVIAAIPHSLTGWPDSLLAADPTEEPQGQTAESQRFHGLKEYNPPTAPPADTTIAIVGATLIDGNGGPPVTDAVVVIRGDTIVAAGPRESVIIPKQAEQIDATGLTLLPGFVDSHFHIGSNRKVMYDMPPLVLSHGVTAARDPGRPIDVYNPVRDARIPMPRMFLTGPHFDQAPPAWPKNAIVLEDADQCREAVKRFVKQGASGIKVYFRLPLESIRATCETAHDLGIPVTAHLEITDADQAIRAGMDGIEHITSFGTVLAEPNVANEFRESVRTENDARKAGRYHLWSTLDLTNSDRANSVLEVLGKRRTFVSPTLATFERRHGDKGIELFHVRGFENMLKFTGMCHKAGAVVVVGSHTWAARGKRGWAFQREMELLVESGMTPMEVISAATLDNARFLGCADRLGSIVPGKLADLLLMEGDPLEDIRATYNIRKVMLNGRWVTGAPLDN
jgi:imidazolonepropionase-like amidohydrolase